MTQALWKLQGRESAYKTVNKEVPRITNEQLAKAWNIPAAYLDLDTEAMRQFHGKKLVRLYTVDWHADQIPTRKEPGWLRLLRPPLRCEKKVNDLNAPAKGIRRSQANLNALAKHKLLIPFALTEALPGASVRPATHQMPGEPAGEYNLYLMADERAPQKNPKKVEDASLDELTKQIRKLNESLRHQPPNLAYRDYRDGRGEGYGEGRGPRRNEQRRPADGRDRSGYDYEERTPFYNRPKNSRPTNRKRDPPVYAGNEEQQKNFDNAQKLEKIEAGERRSRKTTFEEADAWRKANNDPDPATVAAKAQDGDTKRLVGTLRAYINRGGLSKVLNHLGQRFVSEKYGTGQSREQFINSVIMAMLDDPFDDLKNIFQGDGLLGKFIFSGLTGHRDLINGILDAAAPIIDFFLRDHRTPEKLAP